jgi:hypothetical protein
MMSTLRGILFVGAIGRILLGPAPLVSAEDPACEGVPPELTDEKTCEGSGGCPYPGDPSAADPLSCQRNEGEPVDTLLDDHPIAERCSQVWVDRQDIPNIVLLVADDTNWVHRNDVTIGNQRYSSFHEYYQDKVCHGNAAIGVSCVSSNDCSAPDTCEVWSHRCEGTNPPRPCIPDGPGDDASCDCQRCGSGECTTNPLARNAQGQARHATPELDRLAQQGAYFPLGHTAASICKPSIKSILLGHYGKDAEPQGIPHDTPTIPRLLRQTHCSIGSGKVWEGQYDQAANCTDCCPQGQCTKDRQCCGDGQTGFHYSLQFDLGVDPLDVGERAHTMDSTAALIRRVNLARKAFFLWFLPRPPHVDGAGPPAPFKACYQGQAGTHRLRVDGSTDTLPDQAYLGRLSWFDCALGTFLDFLESTPDERFCDPDCTGAPKLIDTTVIMYISDNGKGIRNAKGNWGENGYRNPIMLSYGKLGTFDPGTGTLGQLPSAVAPRIYFDKMAHAIDLAPTAMDYAGANSCTCLCSGPDCIDQPCTDGRCARHRGQSLRGLVEGTSGAAWRRFLLGHKSTFNGGNANGDKDHYVRTSRTLFVGVGACSEDADCAAVGCEGQCGLGRCINGVCTRECTTDADCADVLSNGPADCSVFAPCAGPDCDVTCLNGFCATGSACRLTHNPNNCQDAELYNLANDPDALQNLLDDPTPDPLGICLAQHAQLACELVRWCLEDCRDGDKLECSDCCVANCPECAAVDCGTCLGAGTCVEVQPGQCFDCRRSCNDDSDCADLGTTCQSDDRCGMCQVGDCS